MSRFSKLFYPKLETSQIKLEFNSSSSPISLKSPVSFLNILEKRSSILSLASADAISEYDAKSNASTNEPESTIVTATYIKYWGSVLDDAERKFNRKVVE